MLERVLPSAVAFAETRAEALDPVLFPEEEALIRRAVEKRRREFATGRDCARRALADLGIPAVAIPAGPKGEPRWPPGAVGSITHCDGYRGCAAAPAAKVVAIGIDAEPDAALPEGLLGDVALDEEARRLAELRAVEPAVSWDRLLFCMKEAVYKVWFPLAGRWLGFEDAIVSIDRSKRTFDARLLVAGPPVAGSPLTRLRGRWVSAEGLLLAAIVVPAGRT